MAAKIKKETKTKKLSDGQLHRRVRARKLAARPPSEPPDDHGMYDRAMALLGLLDDELYEIAALLVPSLPKGMWTTESGRKVVFDDGYRPILQIWPDGRIEPADGDERVKDIIGHPTQFYDLDQIHERSRTQQLGECREFKAILNEWRRQKEKQRHNP